MPEHLTIKEILEIGVNEKVSDIYIMVGSPPMAKIKGDFQPFYEDILTKDDTKKLIDELLNDKQKVALAKDKEITCTLSIPGLSRFFVNAFYQRGTISAIITTYPEQPFTIDELNLPPIVRKVVIKRSGLIIISGAESSGKSTTAAAIIEQVNRSRRCYIACVERPIKYVFRNQYSIISQREVGTDIPSYGVAIQGSWCNKADIIYLAEVVDNEVGMFALNAAELGKLVICCLKSPGAITTIETFLKLFPPAQQTQARLKLTRCLEVIMCQTLLKNSANKDMAAIEYVVNSNNIRSRIKTNKMSEIYELIISGKEPTSMLQEQVFKDLILKDELTVEEAYAKALNPNSLRNYMTKNSAQATQ